MYNGKVYWHKLYTQLPKYSGSWVHGEYVESNTLQDVLATISHEPTEEDRPEWVYREVDLITGDVLHVREHGSFNEAYRHNL